MIGTPTGTTTYKRVRVEDIRTGDIVGRTRADLNRVERIDRMIGSGGQTTISLRYRVGPGRQWDTVTSGTWFWRESDHDDVAPYDIDARGDGAR